jgi:hypothetical protein
VWALLEREREEEEKRKKNSRGGKNYNSIIDTIYNI